MKQGRKEGKRTHFKFKKDKFSQFSSFLIVLKKCGKKYDSSLKIGKNFTKDFPAEKIPREFFVK